MIKYLTFSLSITFISWIVGMLINHALRKTEYYRKNLSNINFIKSNNFNKIIGLGAFKWIVKNTFFKLFNQKLTFKAKANKPYLYQMRSEMTNSEISHLTGFGFVSIFALIKVFDSNYVFALVMMIVNIIMNLYPALLQQENKRRIDKLVNKL